MAKTKSFLTFDQILRPYKSKRKTNEWLVLGSTNCVLGEVRWYTAWRRYCFYPCGETIFDPTCLREIYDFMVNKNIEHYTGIKEGKVR